MSMANLQVGPAQPVYIIDDNDLVENGGNFKVVGRVAVAMTNGTGVADVNAPGIYGPQTGNWTSLGTAALANSSDFDPTGSAAARVAKAGDTMTGPLVFDPGNDDLGVLWRVPVTSPDVDDIVFDVETATFNGVQDVWWRLGFGLNPLVTPRFYLQMEGNHRPGASGSEVFEYHLNYHSSTGSHRPFRINVNRASGVTNHAFVGDWFYFQDRNNNNLLSLTTTNLDVYVPISVEGTISGRNSVSLVNNVSNVTASFEVANNGNTIISTNNNTKFLEISGYNRLFVGGYLTHLNTTYVYIATYAFGGIMLENTTHVHNAPFFHSYLRGRSSQTVADGFGIWQSVYLQNSSGTSNEAVRHTYILPNATSATRTAEYRLSLFGVSTEHVVFRAFANSSEGRIGFYGVTPIARQVLATGSGATVDDVIVALQNLGLVKQS